MDSLSQERGARSEPSKQEARELDLTSVERIARGRLPGLEMIYDRFTRNVRAAFTRELEASCSLEFGGLKQEKYGVWLKSLSAPVCAHLFSMAPLGGTGLFMLSGVLAEQLVDILMGGKGMFVGKRREREYSDIERRLLAKFISKLVEEYGVAWEPFARLTPIYKSMESAPQAINVASPTDTVSAAVLEVEIAGKKSELTVVVPMFSLNPIREKLEAGNMASTASRDNSAASKLSAHLCATKVGVSVVLAEGKLKGRDVLNLKVGDVIPLEAAADADAVVKVEGRPKFHAKIGSKSGNRAAVISKILNK